MTPPVRWGAVGLLPPGLRYGPPADAGMVTATTVATAIRLLLDPLPSLGHDTGCRRVGDGNSRWAGTTGLFSSVALSAPIDDATVIAELEPCWN